MSELGHRIRMLREAKGMSQTELADRIGIQFSTVSKYERGMIDNLPAYRIKRLADVLDTTTEYLLEGRLPLSNLTADEDEEEDILNRRPELKELLRRASNMSEDEVRRLMLIAEIIRR